MNWKPALAKSKATEFLKNLEDLPKVPDFWHLGDDGTPVMGPGENRFYGGKVTPGQPYMVGESRPGGLGELFVPDQKGTIIPNKNLPDQSSISIAFNSPLQIVGADGGIVTVGHFNKLFNRKVDNAAFNAPDPVVIA